MSGQSYVFWAGVALVAVASFMLGFCVGGSVIGSFVKKEAIARGNFLLDDVLSMASEMAKELLKWAGETNVRVIHDDYTVIRRDLLRRAADALEKYEHCLQGYADGECMCLHCTAPARAVLGLPILDDQGDADG